MGLTIVQKSDLGVRKENPKIALVLAGGAVTGGAFKLGGLKALDDFLVNRKTSELDTYVGLSAGAMLATPLSMGVSPSEMIRSLDGKSELISRFQATDFYSPNFRELVERPFDYLAALVWYAPELLTDMLRRTPSLLDEIRSPLFAYFRRPAPTHLRAVMTPIVRMFQERRPLPSPFDYFPSGLFDNASIEKYVRYNLERAGWSNDFRSHYRRTGRELYISAMNLDTAERVVFGYDEDASVSISEAVQASTALPGFYRPARIKGVDYVDGGVRRTANIDVAIDHGADLVICYNPFRPFSNRVRRRFDRERGTYMYEGQPIADNGVFSVLSQVLRTLLHSRLQYGLRQYMDDPNFQGDIILIEPRETDLKFFELNSLSYGERLRAARLGYLSVTESIEENYDLIRPIMARCGIIMTRREVRQSVEKMRSEDSSAGMNVLTRDVPRRRLSVA